MLVLGRVNRFVVITCFGWWVGVQGSKIVQLRIAKSLEAGADFTRKRTRFHLNFQALTTHQPKLLVLQKV